MIDLYNGDCLEVMKSIKDNSIDAIITDPPYGTTACKWDNVIPLEEMWKQLNRIIKPNGAIVLFGSEPFSSALRMSNIKNYKYDWIWEKNKINGLIKNQPTRAFENICIFYKKPPTWNEIKIKRTESEYNLCKRTNNSKTIGTEHRPNMDLVLVRKSLAEQWYKKPINILQFNKDDKRNGKQHPTQKPVALMEYLIKTYTNENETVLDFTMGSGTTGVACKNLNRNFIGIEKNKNYFNIANKRIKEHQSQLRLI
tara:strand:- start:8 stop:769 length:762 start_codon:yes stop_codon:yes gene_type:complete